MQTFLPYPDFTQSASTLDRQRLGKQRVECLQILQAMNAGGHWANHPAVRMWRGHVNALVAYGEAICDEWTSRGYQDSCRAKIGAFRFAEEPTVMPPWFGDEAFHRSHRANLVHKSPAHYIKQFGDLPFEPYVWPTV